MKRTGAVLLLLTLVFSSVVTSFGQKLSAIRQPAQREFARFQTVRSFSDGHGALIRWQMEFETRNLGFYIYKVTPAGLQVVNHDLIGGFATRTTFPTGYGETYDFWDVNGTVDSRYVVRSVSTAGGRVSSQELRAKYTDNFQRDTGYPRSYYETRSLNRNSQIEKRDLSLPPDLQRTVNDAVLPPDLNMHRWVVAQPGAKIGIKRDGMYRVTRSELQNAGFNVNSNSANWRLFEEGNEQAIIVGAGDQYIDFYARGIDTAESDTRMYYLIVDNSQAGKRMQSRVLNNMGGTVVSPNYRATVIFKQRGQYNASIRNGDDENYFGNFIADQTRTVPDPNDPSVPYTPFVLDSIDFTAPTANITLRLQGFLNGQHNVSAAINGHAMGFVTGENYDSFTGTFTVPTTYLLNGENFFQLTGVASGADYSYFDTATVEYPRRHQSVGNALSFYTSNIHKAEVTGFTNSNVRVFDITYDSNTQVLENFAVVADGLTFRVKLPSDRGAVMYAATDAAMLQAPSVTFNTPSTLSSSDNAADVIIISYSATDFMNGAQQWAAYRNTETGGSFRTKVVDIADIYDEFGYGVLGAHSVADFLAYAEANWQAPAPRYVLLLGDASYDPRNYEGAGNSDLIPTKMVSLLYQETGSDEALLPDLDQDGRPEMSIGRIPVRTSFHLMTILNKTINFETPAMQNMNRGAVCAYDLPIGFDFGAMCSALMYHVPAGTPVTYVSRGLPPPNQNDPDPLAHANLMSALNAGPYIANYSGHGTAGIWGSSSFFSTNDVPSLANGTNQSIYTMLTCLNGYFIRPRQSDDCIAEALLKATNGGAVATWASSTDTTPDLQLLMGDRFYDQISVGTIKRLGDLVLDAKSFSLPPGTDVGYSWVLLADPALRVRQ